MFPVDDLKIDEAAADPDVHDDDTGVVQGRSLWALAWRRVRSSKIAVAALIVIVLIILIAIFAPVLTAIEGQGPDLFHNSSDYLQTGGKGGLFDLTGGTPGLPVPKYEKANGTFWLGIEPGTGRDIFARMAYGARVSLIIAILSTLASVVLGTVFGALAGYLGGLTDAIISRIFDLMLAFPQLLFTIALAPILQERLGNTFLGKGSVLPIASLVIILGVFGGPYLGRIVRGQVLSLREREFVEAARAIGAKPRRIVFREIVPNTVAVVLVYATLAIPTNITAEAALSFLGVGVREPTPSWGQMLNLSQSNNYYQSDPWYMLVPGLALLITVLSFNLVGDAIRDALDPRSARG